MTYKQCDCGRVKCLCKSKQNKSEIVILVAFPFSNNVMRTSMKDNLQPVRSVHHLKQSCQGGPHLEDERADWFKLTSCPLLRGIGKYHRHF